MREHGETGRWDDKTVLDVIKWLTDLSEESSFIERKEVSRERPTCPDTILCSSFPKKHLMGFRRVNPISTVGDPEVNNLECNNQLEQHRGRAGQLSSAKTWSEGEGATLSLATAANDALLHN